MNSDGDRVAIGATGNDGNGSYSGHVRVYEYSGGSWSQLGSDIDGEDAGDYSGRVSMNSDGDRVAIGASGMMVMALPQVMFESMNILEVPGLSWVVILMGKLYMIILDLTSL